MAGIIPAPTDWSPRVDAVAAEGRRRLVLRTMTQLNLIPEDQSAVAATQGLWLESDGPGPAGATVVKPQPTKGASAYPHFVDYVEQLLIAEYGPDAIYKNGLRIETTLVPELQAAAEAAVNARIENTAFPVDMSLVSVETRTGFIRAMVSGRDYKQSQVNLATGGSTGFQPGSSFKTFVLAAAYEAGIGPETVYQSPVRFKVPFCDGEEGCFVYNYGGGGGGSQTLRRATWSSTNTVYAQLTLDVGTDAVAEVANRMGITSMTPDAGYGISIGLGAYEVSPLEMAGAYATLATGGVRLDPTPISRVVNENGGIIKDNTARQGERKLSTNVAANVSDTLSGVVKSGTGTAAGVGRPAAGKTGTAEDYSNAWFAGYTPQISTAVWMGHVDGTYPLNGVNGVGQVTGGSHPAIAWGDYMRAAHAILNLPVEEFPAPGPLQAQRDPNLKPGEGRENQTYEQVYGPQKNAPPDTTVRAPGRADTPLVTPSDCGGPCSLYGDDSRLLAAPAPSTTTAPAPPPPPPTIAPTTAAPTTAQNPPSTSASPAPSGSSPPSTQKQGT